jgi:membrane-bound ClpP family serine protease
VLIIFGYIMAIPLFPFAMRTVQEYERGVIFRLGRLVGARGPGFFFVLPLVESMQKVDLRIVTVVARSALAPDGFVTMNGEIWAAEAEEGEIESGDSVIITQTEGLRLKVRKKKPEGD